jgi:hypothetical protein
MIWFVLVVLVLALGCSIWLNVVTVRKNLELADQRENLVDAIEEALDMLDQCYTGIAHNAEIPVLSDEPVIREVLSDIKRAKNAMLLIASKVVVYGEEKGAEERE